MLFTSTAIVIGVSQYAFGLFIPPLEETFGWTRTEISASLSFAAVGGLAAPLLGRAMDRFGTRPIIVLSLATFGLSFCLRPLMTELWHWYALSLMQFITFAGATVLPPGKLVAAWFPRTRGRMVGLTVTGNNIGGLVMPVLIAALLAAMSWREASVVLGVVAFAVAGVALLVIRETPSAAHDPRAAPPASMLPERSVRETVRTRAFYAVFAAITLGTFTYSTILPHLFAHLVNEGMSNASALSTLSTFAVAGVGGKLLFGWMSEHYGARRTTMVNLLGQAVFTALLAGAHGAGVLAIAAPLFGLFMGGFGVLHTLLILESFGVRYFGSVMGLVNLGTVISFGIGPLLAGMSYDITGDYGAAFFIVSGFFVASAVLLTFARPRAWEAGAAP